LTASIAVSFQASGEITLLDVFASRQSDANEAETPLTWDFGAVAAMQRPLDVEEACSGGRRAGTSGDLCAAPLESL